MIACIAVLCISLSGCGPRASAPVPVEPAPTAPTPAAVEPAPAAPTSATTERPPDLEGYLEDWQYLGSFLTEEELAEVPRAAVILQLGTSGITATELHNPEYRRSRALTLELPVVAETAMLVRCVDDLYGVRYALYIAKSDLDHERPGRTVILTEAPGDAKSAMPVELAGGAPLTVLAQRGKWTQVEHKQSGLMVRGWLPARDLQAVFARSDFDLSIADSPLRVLHGSDIFDQPHGRLIAELLTDSDYAVRRVHRLGPERGGFAEIEVTTARARVRGYVPAQVVAEDNTIGLGGIGGGGGWGASHTRWLKTPRETLIHQSPDGPIFAMTISDYNYLTVPEDPVDGWVQVRFRTRWRKVSGWVECPALRLVSGSASRFECTGVTNPRP